MIRSTLTAVALAAVATLSQAGVVPSYTTFGALTGATFNTSSTTGLPVSSGIPNNPTAITTGNGLTIGLTAFGRYANPAISNNGAGVFYATAGSNNGLGATPQSIGTTWGFGYYINAGTAPLSGYQIDLYYDLDPSAGTMLTAMGRIDIDAALIGGGAGGLRLYQDAQNLNSPFFSTGNAVTTPPSFVPFNANAVGEYALLLRVTDNLNHVVTEASILVDVVPEPGALALVGLALLGAAAASRRRRA